MLKSVFLFSCLGISLMFHANAQEKPNIILILVDDMGYADLGCYGATKIKTPRIDEMATDGMRFTSYYNAAPLCGPSRAALLTGCYSQRLAEATGKKEYHTIIDKSEILIPEILKPLGYQTAAVGKWHIGGNGRRVIKTDKNKKGLEQYSLTRAEIMPCQKGFDYYYGIPYSNDMTPAVLMQNNAVVEEVGHKEKQRGITTRYTDEALKFINKNKKKPFFLYLAHNMPHTPLWPAKEFEGKSEYGYYGDCVEEIDWNVGRILDKLKELKIDDKTIVIFTSDNGPWIEPIEGRTKDSKTSRVQGGNAAPLRGNKMTSWDGGLRVPFIIRWPNKIKPNLVSDELITSMDLLPTITTLAGGEIPRDRKIDGLDLTSLLKGKTDRSPRKDFYFYKWTHLHAVRDGDWKLVLPRESRPADLRWYNRLQEEISEVQLFNMKRDIGETSNVAKENPKVVKHMMKIVEKAQGDLGDGSRGIKGANTRKTSK